MVTVFSLNSRNQHQRSDDNDEDMLTDQIVNPGEVISEDPGYMRGHGSFGGRALISSLSGRVERVNRLICVEPMKSRYNGEVGDVVIGRIVSVGTKKWLVDTNSRQYSSLQLSSISLPGGVLRRKLESDELQMRNYLVEGDAICVSLNVALYVFRMSNIFIPFLSILYVVLNL